MDLVNDVILPVLLLASSIIGYRWQRDPWSMFVAGFATFWLLNGVLRLLFKSITVNPYSSAGLAVGLTLVLIVSWLSGKSRRGR